MIDPFTFVGRPARVVFGRGKRMTLAAEVERLGASRVLVISTPEQRGEAEMAADLLGGHSAGIRDRAAPHTPMETVCAARQVAAGLGADCYVTVGGGTAISLGKSMALESEKPVLALPTTYSGSEMSPAQGFTKDGVKTTRQDDRMLPRTVIYDPELTLGLPVSYSGPSGINAIAHAVEALYAEHANPIVSLIAEEGIRASARDCPGCAPVPTISKAGPLRSTVPGCAELPWAQAAWRCTTSFATSWAEASALPTRRLTRSFCPTPWPTMHWLRKRP